MPRPRSLTNSRIAAAALEVIDREGLGALSMRTAAAELGIGTMSLYRYVQDRSALERLVVDAALGGVDPAAGSRASSWKKQVSILAERIRSAMSVHPGVVPLLMAHRHSADSVKRCAEGFLRSLTEAGFRGRQRVIALRTLVSYITGALQAQRLGPLSGPGTVVLAEQSVQYPMLAETASHARNVTADEEFRRGLEIVLLGLQHLL